MASPLVIFGAPPSLVGNPRLSIYDCPSLLKIEGCVAAGLLANAIVHSAAVLVDYFPSFSSDPTSEGTISIIIL